MISSENIGVTLKRQCKLLGIARSSVYYKPKLVETNDAHVMNEIREIYIRRSFYGYRRITIELRKQGLIINNKRVLSLMRIAGIKAVYPGKKTSVQNKQHKVYPYLLKGLVIERPNQVWQVDITYIQIKGGFVYLFCLIDVFSRKIMGRSISIFLDTNPCLEALKNALKNAWPEIVNSDQGCQFTSDIWISYLIDMSIKISMDGVRRWADNVYIERLWRTLKYELVYLHSFETVAECEKAIDEYITFYNNERPHQALNYHTPQQIYELGKIPTKQDLFKGFVLSRQSINLGGSMTPKYT